MSDYGNEDPMPDWWTQRPVRVPVDVWQAALAAFNAVPIHENVRVALRAALEAALAAVVSSSPATPPEKEKRACVRCLHGWYGHDRGSGPCLHDDCSCEGFTLRAPSPASPAETREGRRLVDPLALLVNVDRAVTNALYTAGYGEAVEAAQQAIADYSQPFRAASPAVSLPGEAEKPRTCQKCGEPVYHASEHLKGGLRPGWDCAPPSRGGRSPSLPGEQPGGEAQ